MKEKLIITIIMLVCAGGYFKSYAEPIPTSRFNIHDIALGQEFAKSMAIAASKGFKSRSSNTSSNLKIYTFEKVSNVDGTTIEERLMIGHIDNVTAKVTLKYKMLENNVNVTEQRIGLQGFHEASIAKYGEPIKFKLISKVYQGWANSEKEIARKQARSPKDKRFLARVEGINRQLESGNLNWARYRCVDLDVELQLFGGCISDFLLKQNQVVTSVNGYANFDFSQRLQYLWIEDGASFQIIGEGDALSSNYSINLIAFSPRLAKSLTSKESVAEAEMQKNKKIDVSF